MTVTESMQWHSGLQSQHSSQHILTVALLYPNCRMYVLANFYMLHSVCTGETYTLFDYTAVPNTVHPHCMSDNTDNVSETNGFMLSLGYSVNADPALLRPQNVSLGRVASTWHFTAGQSTLRHAYATDLNIVAPYPFRP